MQVQKVNASNLLRRTQNELERAQDMIAQRTLELDILQRKLEQVSENKKKIIKCFACPT